MGYKLEHFVLIRTDCSIKIKLVNYVNIDWSYLYIVIPTFVITNLIFFK